LGFKLNNIAQFSLLKYECWTQNDGKCDENQQTLPNNLLEMSIGQITWLRAKKIKEALNGLIQDI
jgi:hypothetical protein